ncbi:MAG: hypothetical protein QM778_30060 [Myxococcales bacterium]
MKNRPLTWLIATPLLGALGCLDGSTTGRPVALHTELAAAPEITQAFVIETGWTVKLSKAAVSVRALYYFEGEPAFVLHGLERSWLDEIAGWFVLPVAHAHPGHYASGTALGQVLEAWSADLLAGTTELPNGTGITGLYRSARFVFGAPSAGPALTMLQGHAAVAEGVASKGEQTVHFALAVDLAEIEQRATQGQVEGCDFAEAQVEGDGTVGVTIEPHVWFNLVDFGDVAPGSPEAPTQITGDETAHIAFTLGLVQLSAYRFTFQAQP